MASRVQYLAQRVAARMASRGETMILRRVSKFTGPVPARNPPDVSADMHVITGVTVGGQAYLGVAGTSVIGRLVPGDQVQTTASGSFVPVTWAVGTMPTTVQTDSDGIVVVDGSGHPTVIAGPPAIYSPDSIAAFDGWPAIPVTPDITTNPAAVIGYSASLLYAADQTVFGSPLQLQETMALGWTEVDTLGLRIAALNDDGAVETPAIDDQLIVNNRLRAIMSVGPVFSNGVNLMFTVQAR